MENTPSTTTSEPKLYSVKVSSISNGKKLINEYVKVEPTELTRFDVAGRIIQTYPLTHIKRWACQDNGFTLDFGMYADTYYHAYTHEAPDIIAIIKTYVMVIVNNLPPEEAEIQLVNMDDFHPPM